MKYIISFFFLVSGFNVSAQWGGENLNYSDNKVTQFFVGIQAGSIYSHINGIKEILISDSYSSETYTTEINREFGWYAGGFIWWQMSSLPNVFAFQIGTNLSVQKSVFKYDDVDTVSYAIEFEQRSVEIPISIKIYPLKLAKLAKESAFLQGVL